MKKFLYIIIFSAFCLNSFSQRIVQRASQSNTVSDSRLMAALNLFIPRAADTTAANVAGFMGIDTAGSILYTYNDENFWVRAHNPKRWVSWNTQTILPDGVYSGGDVAYTGTGLQFIVSPAVFVLNNTVYNTPQTTLTLDPADPTFGRIDAIILTSANSGEATFVTGTPSANPQEPSLNPTTQIRRAIVTIAAGATTPTDVTQYIVYDENLGTPSEYAVTSDGTIDAGNTEAPYHLTKAIKITALSTAQAIRMIYNDTLHTGDYGNLVGFIRLQTALPFALSYNARLYFEGVPVSPVVNIPLNSQITSQYQIFIILSGSFGVTNIDFDEIRITRSGSGTLPVTYIDYIQWQDNVVPPVIQNRFGLEDNYFSTRREVNMNNFSFDWLNGRINIINRFSAQSPPYDTILNIQSATIPVMTVNSAGEVVFKQSNGTLILAMQPQTTNAMTLGSGMDVNFLTAGQFYINTIRAAGSIKGYVYDLNTINLETINKGITFGTVDGDVAGPHIAYDFNIATAYNDPTSVLFKIREAGNTILNVSADSSVTLASLAGNGTGLVGVDNTGKLSFSTGGASVSNIATNDATGITGGPITTTGTLAIDTTTVIPTKAYVNNQIAANGTFYNSNIGAGFRIGSPFTNTLRTLSNSYALTWDSTTNANTLTPTIDTTLMATRAWVGAGGGGGGSVSAFSFSNANGFTGNVTNASTTPQLTLSTSVTGIIKGNGTAMSAAVSGTDYAPATSGTAIFKGNGAGGFSNAVAGTDYVVPSVTTLTSLTSTPALTTASSLVTVGNITSGGMGTGAVLRGVTMTLGSDASFDMYYRNGSGVLTRLGNGTTGQVLTATTSSAPSWQAVAAALTINSSAINSGTAGRILFQNSSNQVSQSANFFWDNTNSRLGIGTSSPTARLHLPAGTATANTAPLKFTAGTNLTSAAAGNMEFDGTNFYLSPSTTRKRIPLINNATPTNGQIPVGNGTDFTLAAITPGNNAVVITNGSGSITIRLNNTPQTLTDGATITWNATNGYNSQVTLAGTGRTLNITNPVAGMTYQIVIIQDGTGNRTITTWPSGIRWVGGTDPVLSTAANARDVISLYYDGTLYYGNFGKNYLP